MMLFWMGACFSRMAPIVEQYDLAISARFSGEGYEEGKWRTSVRKSSLVTLFFSSRSWIYMHWALGREMVKSILRWSKRLGTDLLRSDRSESLAWVIIRSTV